MKSTTIGPAIAACLAGVTVAGCLASGPRPVKLTAVNTPSTPVSKIDLYYAAAVRAIDARDYAQALDDLQAGRAIAPDDVRVINAFGVVYDKLGRFDLSKRYYAQARQLDPTSRVVENNVAYSERLQGLSREPLAFASAADAEAKLQRESDLIPGSPVVVVPIATGAASVVAIETLPASETAPELFGVAHRTKMAAASAAAVRPAVAQVARVDAATAAAPPAPVAQPQVAAQPPITRIEVAKAQVIKPAPALAAKPVQAQPTAKPQVLAKAQVPAQASSQSAGKSQTKLAGAPIVLVDQSGTPDAAKRLSQRLTRLGWSVQIAPASRAKPVEATRIDYPTRTPQIAQALARTLPGSVHTHVCAGACPAIRLVVGKDARAWSLPKKVVTRS
jgi:tetratricopeptide (TPR) repeat protein